MDAVTLNEVFWAGLADREEACSPNIIGAVAMESAAQASMDLGMDTVARHEDQLIAYALERLAAIPEVVVYGRADPSKSQEKVGAIPFNLHRLWHFLVAPILRHEGGIGVRSGCFCAHLYVVHLLQLPEEELFAWRDDTIRGDKTSLPGMVRASFGCYSTSEDIDRLVDMLERIRRGDYEGRYEVDAASGEYMPQGYEDSFGDFFYLDREAAVGERMHGACWR